VFTYQSGDFVGHFVCYAQEKLIRVMISQIQNKESNSPPVQERCILTLHKLCDNVLSNPAKEGFRKVRVSNVAIQTQVSACRGGEDFLFAAGWRRRVHNLEPYFIFEAASAGDGNDNDDHEGTAAGNQGGSELPMEVLKLAKEVLRKNLALAREKTERYERQKTREKDDAVMHREETVQAIKNDKAKRKAAKGDRVMGSK